MRFWIVSVFLVTSLLSNAAASAGYMSPDHLVASQDGKSTYITAATGRAIIVFNATNDAVTATYPLPDNPTGITLSADDSTLYVTAGEINGKLLVIDAKSGKIRETIPVGHSPVAPVVTADMKTV